MEIAGNGGACKIHKRRLVYLNEELFACKYQVIWM